MIKNLKALEGIRGLTAFYVLVHHARLLLTLPYKDGLLIYPEKYEWYDRLMVYLFSPFKFGHEAVIIFFVLSGFVIHLKQAGPTFNFSTFKLLSYLKKRVIRIYPTLLVSFVLCVLTDYLIYLITDKEYTMVFGKYSLTAFLYNFFLIPDGPIWGANWPVWSLKHEWFFYLIYPLLLYFSSKSRTIAISIPILFFAIYVSGYSIPYLGVASYTLLIWSCGCILANFYVKSISSLKWIQFLLVLTLIYPFINGKFNSPPIMDVIFGLISIGFLALVLSERVRIINNIFIRFAWLGTFSYSLYLLHFPLLNACEAIVLNISPNNQKPYHLWYVLASILIIFPIIFCIYYFTERLAIHQKKKIPN